jgi:signal transduction protein with GAF and PtsI domain
VHVAEAEADALIAELGRLAALLGPAVRPVGADRLLASITQSARQLFNARACSLALLSEDESELVYTTAAGDGAEDVTGMRLPSGKGIAGWVVRSNQPVAISDLQNDARFARDVAQETGYVPTALLAVPVSQEDQVLGVLTLLDRDASRPGAEQDMALLAVFAEQTALTLQSERAFSDLGRVLLAAVASAAEADGDLALALQRNAGQVRGPDVDLTELAAVFAMLDRQGAEERRLAVRLVREVAAFTGRQPSRPRR